MKLIKGSTRWVLLTKQYAMKIPSLHSWECFLTGLLANMQEVKFSKCKEMQYKLCPVIFYLSSGLLVVMPKVRVLQPKELSKKALQMFLKTENFQIPAETKYDSFGYYNYHLVVIDYGS